VSAALAASSLDSMLQLRAGPGVVGRLGVSQECLTSLTAALLIPLSGPVLTSLGYQEAALVFAAGAAVFLLMLLLAVWRWRGGLFLAPLAIPPAGPKSRLETVAVEEPA
jgi:hypothetical protein